MNNKCNNTKLLVCVFFLLGNNIYAQQPSLQYYRQNNKNGLNIYEATKADTVKFTGLKVRVGGDFAMQFQSLNQGNDLKNLVELGSNFNLPTANLNLDVQLLDGVKMHLRTYLSSRHHNDTWIKGGHLQIDKLSFIKPGFMDDIMKYGRITIGLDEFNYGDAHFRRSDNARAIFNPFVGNFIMDAFVTEAFGEITIFSKVFLGVIGLTNGKMNQSVVVDQTSNDKPSVYGKLGFDRQINKDLRVRLTGSFYINNGTTTGTLLYGGDRAGCRYYSVLYTTPDSLGKIEGTDWDGRYIPRFTKLTSIQFNPFVKYKGLELFGIYEIADGNNVFTVPTDGKEGAFTQLAVELLYRFGKEEKFYIGGRYNSVTGKMNTSDLEKLEIRRINIGVGWFLSENIMTKIEYVNQIYSGNGWIGRFAGAWFSGCNVEAVISF